MELTEIIRECQRAVGVTADGMAGAETWAAIYRAVVRKTGDPAPALSDISVVDPRSEKNIATLLPQVRPMARALVQAAAAQSITIRVISGTRTYEEQDALYAQSRTASGSIVTNARGGWSNHNFGIAFDIGVFVGGQYIENDRPYMAVGALGKSLGLEWGGDWRTIQDYPHFQLRPKWAIGMSERDMLAELRDRKARGMSAFDA